MLESTLDPHELRIVWERLDGDRVVTAIWQNGAQLIPLIHVAGFGFFHRLVVSCPALDWQEDLVFAVSDARVRFVTGTVRVERARPDPVAKLVEGRASVEVAVGTEDISGRFIDVIAPGDDPEKAELRAQAILGLVALCLGENAIGAIESSEPYEVQDDGTQTGAYRTSVARFPRTADL